MGNGYTKKVQYLAWASCLLLVFLAASASGQRASVTITEPDKGGTVCYRDWVRGKVSDPGLQVYVLVRTATTEQYWVQPLPERGGRWEALGYFGTADQGVGDEFEVLAVASRDTELFESGQALPYPLPAHSRVLAVSRTVKVMRIACLKDPTP